MFCKAKSAKKKTFLCGDFRPLPNKNVQMLDHFFSLLFPKDSESLKILHIRLREVGAKRPLNVTSKVNTQTNTQADISTYRKHRPRAKNSHFTAFGSFGQSISCCCSRRFPSSCSQVNFLLSLDWQLICNYPANLHLLAGSSLPVTSLLGLPDWITPCISTWKYNLTSNVTHRRPINIFKVCL